MKSSFGSERNAVTWAIGYEPVDGSGPDFALDRRPSRNRPIRYPSSVVRPGRKRPIEQLEIRKARSGAGRWLRYQANSSD